MSNNSKSVTMETKKENLPAQQQQNQVASFDFFNPLHFETMQRVCKMFASSELVPEMYKASDTNPIEKAMANCMIAVEMAQRIGASPLMIMQNMVVIYGRPSWSSKFLVATVNTCGRFEPLKYKFTNLGMLGKIDYTDYEWNAQAKKKLPVKKEFDGTKVENLQCIAYTTAKGSDEVLESAPIDIRLAVQEGWYTKAGSKWQTMTRQMLMYRAASFWTNAYAPELSMGMKTEDELRDIIDIPYEDVTNVDDKVKKEKSDNANKTVINMDDFGKQPEPTQQNATSTEKPEEGNEIQEKKPQSGELFDKQNSTPKKPTF